MGINYESLEVDTSFLLSAEANVGWLFIETNAEAFELTLNNLLVLQRLQDIQHNKNKAAGSGNGDYLPTTTFTILGTFNNTGQIQQLKRVNEKTHFC
jgi:hypothetical protein